MELRLIVAYGLIALIVLFFAGLVVWRRYNSFEQTLARRRLRELEDEKRLAEREAR